MEQEIDGVIKRIWDPIISYKPKTRRDLMSEAVKEIFRIRSERVKLLAAENEVPDGKSLQVILKEFDRMERDYLSLFMGTSLSWNRPPFRPVQKKGSPPPTSLPIALSKP